MKMSSGDRGTALGILDISITLHGVNMYKSEQAINESLFNNDLIVSIHCPNGSRTLYCILLA